MISGPSIRTGCVFQLQKFKADGTITYTGPEFSNLVLNTGLDSLISSSPADFSYCNVGTGGGYEQEWETGLITWVTSSNNVINSETYHSSGVGYDYPAFRSWRRVYEFGIGSISQTISEIGMSIGSDGSYLNRHRIVDVRGIHIGLNVLHDEGLRVWVQTFVFATHDIDQTEQGSFVFNSTDGPIDIGYTWRLLSGWLTSNDFIPGRVVSGDIRIVQEPTSTYNAGTAPSSISAPYTNGDFFRDVTAHWDAGVLSGEYWGLLVQHTGASFSRIDFDTPIVMDNEGVAMTLTVRRSWGRTLQEGIWV